MSFIQDERLISLVDVPVLLPQALVPAGASMAIATIQLAANQTIDYRWLQVTIAAAQNTNSTDPCGISAQNEINQNYLAGSLVSVFLIQNWSPTADPWTQTVLDAVPVPPNSADAPGTMFPIIVGRQTTTPLSITTAGNYTFVVLNNSTNRDLAVTVTGAVTVDTDPVATS